MFSILQDRLSAMLLMTRNIVDIVKNPLNNSWQIKRALFMVGAYILIVSTLFSAGLAILNTLSANVILPTSVLLFVPANAYTCFVTLISLRILIVIANFKFTIFAMLMNGWSPYYKNGSFRKTPGDLDEMVAKERFKYRPNDKPDPPSSPPNEELDNTPDYYN